MLRRIKSLLITIHLYSGLALCLLFAVWFVSGVAMAYYRTPVLTEAQRLTFSVPLDALAGSIPPSQVSGVVRDWDERTVLRLGELQGRPVYRWRTSATGWHSAWADTGNAVSFNEAVLHAEAERWFGDRRFRYDGEFYEHSQWSYFAAARDHYPLHRFSTEGLAPRQVFFSSRTGEPVVATSFGSRILYYLGPGLHYFSFYPIRNNDPLWRALVNWSSGIGAVSCLIGLILGLWQLRWRTIGNGGSLVPYTRRWLRWHHWTGLLFGLLTFTFVLSGLFSMNPAGMFPSTEVPATVRTAFQGPLPAIQALPSPSELVEALQVGSAPRELEWKRLRGQPYVQAVENLSAHRLFFRNGDRVAERAAFSDAELLRLVRDLIPTRVDRAERLSEFDEYYYARKDRHLPLPALRVSLVDDASTWYYLDPATGQPFLKSDAGTRVRRWAYNGLHSFDLQFLLRRGYVWDVVIWVLSLCGLALSVTGCVIAWQWVQRRLTRRRTVRAPVRVVNGPITHPRSAAS